MITAMELRIGNIFNSVRNDKVYLTIKSITENKVEASAISADKRLSIFTGLVYNFEDLMPIPLTREILKNTGFEITYDESIVHIYDGYFAMNGYREGGEYFWLRWYQAHTQPKIKYVHQLQNLYFDMTGKKLEIKL